MQVRTVDIIRWIIDRGPDEYWPVVHLPDGSSVIPGEIVVDREVTGWKILRIVVTGEQQKGMNVRAGYTVSWFNGESPPELTTIIQVTGFRMS